MFATLVAVSAVSHYVARPVLYLASDGLRLGVEPTVQIFLSLPNPACCRRFQPFGLVPALEHSDRLSALSERGENDRRLTKVCKSIDGLLTAITERMYHPSMKTKMDKLEADRSRLEAALGGQPGA